MQAPPIALFLGNLEMGGAERVFVILANQFAQQGHPVRLILAQKTGPLLDELSPAVEIIDLQAGRPGQPSWLFALRTLLALRRHLRDHPPGAMLSTLTGANLVAILARALSGQSFRLVIREAVTLSNVRSRLRLLAMRWLYPHADRVVALTESMRNQLCASLNLAAPRMDVIGNPLDTRRISQLLNDQREWQRSQLHRPYWLAIGRLAAQKDFATLIEAAAHLKEDDDPRFVILGEGPLRQELQAQTCRLGLESRVTLAGLSTNPFPWLANASGFILCSRWEGYPNALLEALHFNLPIVATRYDDSITDLLSPGVDAPHRIVPVADPPSMADAIRSLVRAERSEKNGRLQRIPPTASPQTVAQRYLALLLP